MIQVHSGYYTCAYSLVNVIEIDMLRAQKCNVKLNILLISKSGLLGQGPKWGSRFRACRTGGHVHSIQNTSSTLHDIQRSSNQGAT